MRFGSLGGLLRQVAKHLGQRWVQAVNEAVGDKTGLEAIYAVVDTQERLLAPPASGLHVQYLILFHSMDPGAEDRLNTSRVLTAQQRDLARWIAEGMRTGEIQQGVEPLPEAESILGSLIGIIFRSLVDPNFSPAEPSAKLKEQIAARLMAPSPSDRESANASATRSTRRD